jgi:hypothetical protein
MTLDDYASHRECRECGERFAAKHKTREFCCASCRAAFHNRRKQRGADLYDLFMSCRFDRAAAQDQGARTLMCRMAAAFRLEDHRERAGRQSWDSIEAVEARNAHLNATVIETKGRRRASGGRT